MAIARGAGTEIIRCHNFIDIDDTARKLIIGVQHHIYTVLSVVVHANALNAPGDWFKLSVLGYDNTDSASNQRVTIFKQAMNTGETFVFNDKFSFNGAEPTGYAGTLDDATKQDAIVDQANSGQVQFLEGDAGAAADDFHVIVTFIDQNNS